ncbi:succinate dehydrogenase cytochrome b subunit [Sandaracinus amylolyticus]|uniref:succinate dehydrogenase cytochrome b subunit n=1 Tax=Sandaracinus amylolyticus TaxID=927083 RepID=UPI001F3991E3|nr:succinate dehydrogenase cytochrome b subunit [Sandaracinus amylolyticus]UJR78971.1 Succinate dehydrogenase cytochrome b subunit [Sandaracinus amylolyticus]
MQKALTLTRTSIGKKALVAITGAILFAFVIGHLIGNLQVFLGPEHLNAYAEFLHSMPKALWTARAVLLLALIVHVGLTVQLAVANSAARPNRYKVSSDVGDQGPLMRYARKTMILSGPIVFAFIAFHLAHLTIGADVIQGYRFDPHDVYLNVVYGFRSVWVTSFYVFANILLGFHLYQGGQSLLQSLGLRSPRFDQRVRGAAMAFAAFVTLGNVLIPLTIMARVVGGDVPDLPALPPTP